MVVCRRILICSRVSICKRTSMVVSSWLSCISNIRFLTIYYIRFLSISNIRFLTRCRMPISRRLLLVSYIRFLCICNIRIWRLCVSNIRFLLVCDIRIWGLCVSYIGFLLIRNIRIRLLHTFLTRCIIPTRRSFNIDLFYIFPCSRTSLNPRTLCCVPTCWSFYLL